MPDNINLGDRINILSCNHEKLYLDLEPLYLSPDNGSSDVIDISIKSESHSVYVQGCIEVTYGFIKFDEDGGAGDGCEENIEYRCKDTTDFLVICR